ncbi:MAG: hypothetical protein KBE91_01580 [Bacteroidia bacterium]|nr:hypothetical protein [Bacteroidia bacterium]
MTTLENVKLELTKLNLDVNASQSVFNAVISVLHFGESVLKTKYFSVAAKNLILELAKKDGRKSVYCEVTCKNYLR